MKLVPSGQLIAYRMHIPRWASDPLSGNGAGRYGGRANRIGLPALYLALDAITAVQEYQQTAPLMPPGTLVTYKVNVNPVVDFCSGYNGENWEPLWAEFSCDWRKIWFNERVEPPSWELADEVIAAGGKGILFASQINPGGINLVVFTDYITKSDALEVYDPNFSLPKNQDSWK